uniref:7TM GPCR serpentine receptor class x (Srx) domain-containing protein n=1 Tax=Panagrolaimus sp. JU765 TaxID=591449 RepID=A0AC34Q0A2_9BILA
MESSTIFVSTERSGGDGHEMPVPITRYWTAILMLIVASVGLIANGIAIRFIRKTPILQNCFGLLLISQALSGGGILVGFLLWAVPMTIT